MTPRIHKSTDVGAPILTGLAGSLNDLLIAALVTGIGTPYGSPWTKEYEDVATKVICLRPPAGTRHYLQIKDNGQSTGSFREAQIRGYVAMTGFNTGTEPFPTVTQQTNGLCVRKSSTLDGAPRAWRIQFDDKTCYLWVECFDGAGAWDMYAFGDWLSWKPNNIFASMIIGRPTENTNLHSYTYNGGVRAFPQTATANKIFIPRDYNGFGTALEIGVLFDSSACNSVAEIVPGGTGQLYPYPIDNGIIITPYKLGIANLTYGRTRGLWMPGHAKPLLQDDTFTAMEGALQRDFITQNMLTTGQVFIETSNTWDTD